MKDGHVAAELDRQAALVGRLGVSCSEQYQADTPHILRAGCCECGADVSDCRCGWIWGLALAAERELEKAAFGTMGGEDFLVREQRLRQQQRDRQRQPDPKVPWTCKRCKAVISEARRWKFDQFQNAYVPMKRSTCDACLEVRHERKAERGRLKAQEESERARQVWTKQLGRTLVEVRTEDPGPVLVDLGPFTVDCSAHSEVRGLIRKLKGGAPGGSFDQVKEELLAIDDRVVFARDKMKKGYRFGRFAGRRVHYGWHEEELSYDDWERISESTEHVYLKQGIRGCRLGTPESEAHTFFRGVGIRGCYALADGCLYSSKLRTLVFYEALASEKAVESVRSKIQLTRYYPLVFLVPLHVYLAAWQRWSLPKNCSVLLSLPRCHDEYPPMMSGSGSPDRKFGADDYGFFTPAELGNINTDRPLVRRAQVWMSWYFSYELEEWWRSRPPTRPRLTSRKAKHLSRVPDRASGLPVELISEAK